jgi:hypothetical protein
VNLSKIQSSRTTPHLVGYQKISQENFQEIYTHSQPTTKNQRDQNLTTYSVKQNRSREQKKSPPPSPHLAMAKANVFSPCPIGAQPKSKGKIKPKPTKIPYPFLI